MQVADLEKKVFVSGVQTLQTTIIQREKSLQLSIEEGQKMMVEVLKHVSESENSRQNSGPPMKAATSRTSVQSRDEKHLEFLNNLRKRYRESRKEHYPVTNAKETGGTSKQTASSTSFSGGSVGTPALTGARAEVRK